MKVLRYFTLSMIALNLALVAWFGSLYYSVISSKDIVISSTSLSRAFHNIESNLSKPEEAVTKVLPAPKLAKKIVKTSTVKLAKKIKTVKFNKISKKKIEVTNYKVEKIELPEVKELVAATTAIVDGAINNDELISLTGFNIEETEVKVSWSNFFETIELEKRLAEIEVKSNVFIAESSKKKMDIQKDTVKRELSSVSKPELDITPLVESPRVSETSKKDQLEKQAQHVNTQFDVSPLVEINDSVEVVSSKQIKEQQEQRWNSFKAKKPISNVVSKAIARAKNSHGETKKKVAVKSVKNISYKGRGQFKNRLAVQPKKQQLMSSQISKLVASDLKARKQKMSSQNISTIRTVVGKIGVGFGDDVHRFQFIPQYDINKFFVDSDGVVTVKHKLNNDYSTLRGTLSSRGFVSTKIDLPISKRERETEFVIPLIDQQSYEDFLNKEKIKGIGGHLLVELSDEVVDVDIDSKYEVRINLNENLVPTTSDDFSFVLYAGVNPGNALIAFRTSLDKVAEKVIHITDSELYFESNTFKKSKVDRIHLNEMTLFGEHKADIDESDIKFFNTKIKAKELVPGVFNIKHPIYPDGFRKYLEIKKGPGSIFVGYTKNKKINIPSESYISEILGAHNISSLEGSCVIQANLTKPVLDIYVDGESSQGAMSKTVTYFDKKSGFSNEPSELSKQMFIVGEQQGVVNIKIEYLDESVDYIQSFCSDSTYLVEQL